MKNLNLFKISIIYKFFLLTVILNFSFLHSEAAASVSIDYRCFADRPDDVIKAPSPNIYATIDGPIEYESAMEVIQYYRNMINNTFPPLSFISCTGRPKTTSLHITLNSTGGDLEAALEIGKLLLSLGHLGSVEVAADARCLSSCVLILAGAQSRSVHPKAKIGIHRPYLRNAIKTDPPKMKKQYDEIARQLKTFFKNAGVEEQLADHMMRIPPEKMAMLSRDQLLNYGLAESSPAIQEAEAMNEAIYYGISRQELARRIAYAERVCPKDDCATLSSKCIDRGICMGLIKGRPLPGE